MKSNGFPKSKKLKKENEISLLFKKGKWKTVGNIRVITYSHPDFAESKVGVSASKRYFKKAVDRNRVKRLLREAYRMEKQPFEQWAKEKQVTAHLFFAYQYKDLPKLEELKSIMNVIFTKIATQYKS